MSLKYAVVGTGAIGGYFGGRLAEAGKDVHFLLHSDYEHVKEHGLKVDSVEGDFHLKEVNCYKSSSDMPVCNVVLVCLKTTQNYLLKDILPPLVNEKSLVILIQNGFGLEAELAKDFSDMNIAGGLAFIGSGKVGPGHISHTDFGRINIGMFQGEGHDILEIIQNDFADSKVQIELTKNLVKARWQKLVWNVPYNGLCVVMNCTCDKLNAQPDMRSLVHDLMMEVVEASVACGYPLDAKAADKMLAHTDSMTPYSPSMKLDFDNKRAMEIEAIYSLSVKEAARHGYAMKKVEMLEKQLKFIQENFQQTP